MATVALLVKDLREHRTAALLLALGCLAVVLLLLAQNAQSAYSMSAFEIVRFALLSFLPLVALIIGNRLIVREYLSGTRLYVEALPIGSTLPLVLKYLLGLLYLSFLSVAMVLLAANQSGIADDVTRNYTLLILGKTWVMTILYWSVVFCFSLCGYLRIALYLVSAALVALLAYYPGIDADRFPPFALMDDQLFVFERDSVPWFDIGGTLLISLVFTLTGFLLTRVGEGSVVERLAKPMTRRDFVALGVLAFAGLALWSALLENKQREPVEFSSQQVVRLNDPSVAVLYLDDAYKESAQIIATRTHDSLTKLQATLGLAQLPRVKLALIPSREKHDIDYATADGVLISANWLEHDSYDDAILDSVLMHGVLSSQTGGRAMFEPYHWVLDGFTRWWVEQGDQQLDSQHAAELLARALWVIDRQPLAHDLVQRWQLTADQFSYPSAEALAWSAMTYLEHSQGRDRVIALALEFLTQPIGSSLLSTIQDRRESVQLRVERVIGMELNEFYRQWKQWLEEQRADKFVQSLRDTIPALAGRVDSDTDASGVHRLQASYVAISPATTDPAIAPGQCIMKHDYLGPFDTEFEVTDDYEDISDCTIGEAVHVVNSVYSPGDRVFIALDYENDVFHQPLRLHAERLTIQ